MSVFEKIIVSFILFSGVSSASIAQNCPNIAEYGAVANSSANYKSNTTIINSLLASRKCAHIPDGAFFIEVGTGGIKLSSGNTLKGINSERSMLVAADRVSGAMVSRRSVVNTFKGIDTKTGKELWDADYVSGVVIKNIGLLMNHDVYNTQNSEMIGIDFTSISGSRINDVYVGNIPWGAAKTLPEISSNWSQGKKDLVQGIGVMVCTRNSSDGNLYAGGERNVITRARVWGAKIGVSIDDHVYCSTSKSSAHGTIVRDSDIQTVQYGIAQQSQHAAGITLTGNTIQDFVSAGSNPNTLLAAYVLYGYASRLIGGYIEGRSTNPIYILYLGDESKGNHIELGYVSMHRTISDDPSTEADDKYVEEYNKRIGSITDHLRLGGVQNKIIGFDTVNYGSFPKEWKSF